jgi:hypothetical protein
MGKVSFPEIDACSTPGSAETRRETSRRKSARFSSTL